MFNLQNVGKVDVARMEVVKLKGNFRALLSLRGFLSEKADMYQAKSLAQEYGKAMEEDLKFAQKWDLVTMDSMEYMWTEGNRGR